MQSARIDTFLRKDATVVLMTREFECLLELGKHLKAMLPPLGTKQVATLLVQLNQTQISGLSGRDIRD